MSLKSPVDDRVLEYGELLRPHRLRSLGAREILSHALRFERHQHSFFAAQGSKLSPLNISVVASHTADHLCAVLKLFLVAEGFAPEFKLGGYDAFASGGLAPDSQVWDAAPQAILLLPAIEDIKIWPRLFASDAEVDDWIERQAAAYISIWQVVAQRLPNCRIYHALFAPPLERALGHIETSYAFSRTRCVQALNAHLVARRAANTTLIDLDYLSGLVGRQHWHDESAFFLSKQPMSLREMPVACAFIARLMGADAGKVRKCLVLDLDNTLWGGVVGDDGVSGIRLDPSDPVGEAHLRFQSYVLALKQRGVLLAVCSKNDEAVARAPFERNPNMLLKLDDFAAFRANWNDKSANIRRIAKDLNIGLDSLVFFDDNPAERAIIEEFAPEVWVVDVPKDPAYFVRALDLSFAFEWPQLTSEDLDRSATYADDRKRQELETQFVDYDAYLASLDMKAWIEPVGDAGVRRVAQLIGKTNQFTVRKQSYSEGWVAELTKNPEWCVLQVRFADRFSNYGVVASVILKLGGTAAFIDTWVMSCRVFERGLERATLNAILDHARQHGLEHVVGELIPTPRNSYVSDLFDRLGFQKAAPDTDIPVDRNGTLYVLSVADGSDLPHHINVMASPEKSAQLSQS